MFEFITVGKMGLEVDFRGFDRTLYLRSAGDFASATPPETRQLAREMARTINRFGREVTMIDTRFAERPTRQLSQFHVCAEECAKILPHHHRVAWLFEDREEPARAMRYGAQAMNRTGRLRSAAFSGWDETMAYMREPGLMDPARFNRHPRLGTATLPSSRIIGSQASLRTRATPSRPQV